VLIVEVARIIEEVRLASCKVSPVPDLNPKFSKYASKPEKIFEKILFELRLVIVEVAATSELVLRLVEVELVIVPFVLLMLDIEILPAERFVSVALPALISAFAIFTDDKLVVPVALIFVVFKVES
jgi:hypothetical protein